MNLFLFNFIFGLSRKNFLLDGTGIFFAKYVPYILMLGFFWLLFKESGWRKRLFFFSESAIAVILSRGLLTEIIRFFYHSPRPFELLHLQPLIPESGSSFPSGHAAFYFALATIIFFHYIPLESHGGTAVDESSRPSSEFRFAKFRRRGSATESRGRRLGIWYFGFSFLNGVARVFVGVHWPLDIVGGAVLGILCGLFTHWLLSGYSEVIKKQSVDP